MSLRTNTVYNLAGALAPMLIAILTVPPYLRVIGLERYGVMSLFWVVLTYFGLFDLGLGRAVSQRLASLGDTPGGKAAGSAIVWSGLIISAAMGLAGAALLVPVASLVIDRFDANAGTLSDEIRASIPLLAATLPVALLQGIAAGALTGRERFGAVNLAEGASNIMTVAAPLVVAMLIGPALSHLIATVLVVRTLATGTLLVRMVRIVPLGRPVRPDRSSALGLISFGGWITVDGLVGTAIALWDRFVIGAMLGAAAVSIYAIPSTLVMRLLIVPGALGRAFFPRLARMTEGAAQDLTADGVFAVSLILAPAIVGMITLIGPFLMIWIGPALAVQSAPIANLLLPAIYANGLASMLLTLIQARNRPATLAWLHIAEAAPYALLLFVAIRWRGVEGAAFAWSLRTMLDAVALAFLSRLPMRTIAALVLPTGLVIASAVISYALPATRPAYWLLQSLALALTTACVLRQAPAQVHVLLRSLPDRLSRRRTT